MDLNSISLFQGLRGRLRWIAQNQTVIAENIANADTPDYQARRLKDFDFRATLSGKAVSLTATEKGHMTGHRPAGDMQTERDSKSQVSLSGNSVVLEEEMIRATENAMQHKLATSLYQKHLAMIRTVLRSGGEG